jgi:hypothetical protein
MHMRRLPLIESCQEDWAEMRPEGRGRHCDACDRNVVDLSAMTEREARRVIEQARGRVCVRYAIDEDDEVMFRARTRGGLERLAVGVAVASMLSAPALADVAVTMDGRATAAQMAGGARHGAQTAKKVAGKTTHGPTGTNGAPPERHKVFMGIMAAERDLKE